MREKRRAVCASRERKTNVPTLWIVRGPSQNSIPVLSGMPTVEKAVLHLRVLRRRNGPPSQDVAGSKSDAELYSVPSRESLALGCIAHLF
jgi:hypothetical protein